MRVGSVPAASTAFAQWEVDALMRVQMGAAHSGAAQSLGSLGDVVRAIPNMILQPNLSAHLHTAIRALHTTRCVDFHLGFAA